MGIVIGKRGDTLDSLQYLTSLVVNRASEGYIKISIDTENYREKRSEALEALAQRLAAKVARTGKKFTLEPMNPYERRIIHSSLQDNEDVTTYSIGQEPYRKVVIAPKNPTAVRPMKDARSLRERARVPLHTRRISSRSSIRRNTRTSKSILRLTQRIENNAKEETEQNHAAVSSIFIRCRLRYIRLFFLSCVSVHPQRCPIPYPYFCSRILT